MNKVICILFSILLGSCLVVKKKQSQISKDYSAVEKQIIMQTFSDVDSLLKIDNGKFWGKQLYGPIIIIDPETRVFYSNENNSANDFEEINSIYTAILPAELIIANTAFNWNDKRWAMVMLPLPTDKISRNNLVIHELFHRLQPELGYENLQDLDNGHLDTYEGRVLLKLELKALEHAINSDNSFEKLKHIQNALTFRNKRYKNKEIKNAENSLEINEGLAEYTALMLGGKNENQIKSHLIQSTDDFHSNPTFVRSFAYHTIPFYGYLLSMENPTWHKVVNRETNLTDFFIKSFGANSDTKQTIEKTAEENGYNYHQIENEETQRENIRIDKIEKLKIKFADGQTLELHFKNMNISFDPTNLTPLENYGTVYPNLRITDDWGILIVENEALVASDWSKVIVTAPIKIKGKIVEGSGWKLELNPEWKVRKTGNKFTLEKE